jgi:hypothetical protein
MPHSSSQLSPVSTSGESRRRTVSFILLLLALTVALTWPVVPRLATHLLGDGDAWQFCWNKWWLAHSLLNGEYPFCTDYIYYPTGSCAYLHTWNFPTAFVAFPLQFLLSLNTVTNLLALASFVLGGYGMYRLARWFGIGLSGATLAAVAFAFGPYHFSHARGHFNLVHYQWIPFFLYVFLEGTHSGWTRRRVMAAGAWLMLIGLTDWYYFVFTLTAAGIILLTSFYRQKRPPLAVFGPPMVILCISLLALSPLLAGMIWQSGQIPAEAVTDQYSADLASFVVPGPVSTFGNAFSTNHERWTGNPAEWGTFIPWSVLLISVLGWRHFNPEYRLLLALWLPVFFILSLGPYLHVDGYVFRDIPLPFHWLSQIPGLDIMRAPVRFHLMTYLGCCLIYGAAVQSICPADRRRWPALLLGTVLVVETLCIPLQTTATAISPFYESLRERPLSEAVIDLHYGSRAMFYQTVHHKKIMGTSGMLSREPEAALRFLEDTPAIRAMLDASNPHRVMTGWPAQVIAAIRPDTSGQALAVGYVTGQGMLEVNTPFPHELRLDGRSLPVRVSSSTYVTSAELRGRHLVRLRISLDGAADLSLAGGPFLYFHEGDARIPLLADLPGIQVEPFIGSTGNGGFFWLIYPSHGLAGQIPPTFAEELRALGFRWIVQPFYGNDVVLRDRLGLTPVFSDQWIQAFDLEATRPDHDGSWHPARGP